MKKHFEHVEFRLSSENIAKFITDCGATLYLDNRGRWMTLTTWAIELLSPSDIKNGIVGGFMLFQKDDDINLAVFGSVYRPADVYYMRIVEDKEPYNNFDEWNW